MLYYSTIIDYGGKAEANIDMLRAISHHVQFRNSQLLSYYISQIEKVGKKKKEFYSDSAILNRALTFPDKHVWTVTLSVVKTTLRRLKSMFEGLWES